ncbi:pre-peptidase C-terminal domain-containing protein [Massilia pseudoviolaceinigra]|uniref:pre-peptidase C-terminal domain-containing protein n=1 Tax=Massilia pseudoviolaceinigra TaxID=3057165 RepID=UPI0027968699|nr:pre-peptidase C-terminal domain-containing protein [Massilia sp. CCM 9206]MDQ1921957.1 pre-peptidase C-terminal domain-containing protein [Massilia sp. CCM 9206]
MKSKQTLFLLMAAAFAAGATAQTDSASAQRERPAPGMEIGSVDAVLSGFAAQHANGRSMQVQSMRGNTVAAHIRDYANKNGVVSITGTAVDTPDSVFVLKGNKRAVYGYLLKYDTRKAYEYTTDSAGKVWLTEVPITKIVPDFDPEFRDKRSAAMLAMAVSHPVYSPMALRQARHIGPYQNEDVTQLQSKPGSPYVFYLNITAVMNGSTPLNGVTKENMYRAWQSIADQYSMLNLNVTTSRAVYDAARTTNLLRTGIINFINQDGRSFAPLRSFGTTAAGTLYRNPSSGFDYGYGIGMTGAHEVGHQMGMNHDRGGSGGEYFEGIAAYQWGPIMGNYWMGGGWANQLFTWSRGEYTTASNFEDDLRIMTVDEAVPYMADDIPSTRALTLGTGGAIDPTRNFGQIERNTDTDTFTFTTTGTTTLNLRIDPLEYLRMLDVDASILNAAGAVVSRSNLGVNRSAQFTNLSLPAGSYRLVVRGGAEGTPANGFSNYSSLGHYAMKGTLAGAGGGYPVLGNGVALTGQGAAAGSWQYYTIDVPAGKTQVAFALNGANGDADMFVKLSGTPTTASYNCKSDGPSSVENCSINAPAAGRYYVGVYAYSAYNTLSVKATYAP